MHDNLYRVEQAVCATSSGNLTPGSWPHDSATALGFAGRTNPLGFAVVRYLSDDPSASNAWGIIMHLSSLLIRKGYEARITNEAAWKALEAWNDMRCPKCAGRGVLNIEQRVCHVCNGTGRRDVGSFSDMIRDGISALMEAEKMMEGQLSARLKSPTQEVEQSNKNSVQIVNSSSGERYKLHLPTATSGTFVGFGACSRTTPKPTID